MTKILAVSQSGKNVLTAVNPNDFIFHSLYNTFKIVYQGLTNVGINTSNTKYQFAHNSPLVNTTCMMVFVKWPDGKVNLVSPQTAGIRSFDEARSLGGVGFDNTNIYINYGFVSSNFTLPVAWLIFEADLS